MVEAIAALVNATAENARLLREMAQNNRNIPQGDRGHNNRDETTYVDFTNTRPLVFTRADEPLEADDWLHTMEQKFDLIHCTEFQKPMFMAQ
jgi:threonine aldolase